MKQQKRIMIGLSGGVDSAVAAYCLKTAGYDVHALFMKNWEEDDDLNHCPAAQDREDARQVAHQLDIPFHTVNFAQAYWEKVFTYFLDTYQKGWTPNPDILCNQEIKFKAFLDYAIEMGADAIATGHYAGLRQDAGRVCLVEAADKQKDQTYFLHRLNQHQLSLAHFPLSGLQKSDVRGIAQQSGFDNHAKKDSTGICFIGERHFKSFLSEYLLAQPGEMTTPTGAPVGRHDGLMYYTLGQRQGLNIGGVKGAPEAPWYVVGKHIASNTLIVAQGQEHPWHYSTALEAAEAHWIAGHPPAETFTAMARVRYRQPLQACTVTCLPNQQLSVVFDTPQRAVTPGQACAIHLGDVCLGGATITGTNSPGGLQP